jgi:ribosome-associated translation inhibitor RaiA
MATYSKKGEDPAALSGIPDTADARGIRWILDAASAAMPPAMDTPDEFGRPAAPNGAREMPTEALGADPVPDGQSRHVVRAANDDRQSIGQIMQSLQRRPARAPFLIASLFAALWTVAAMALIDGFGEPLRQISNSLGWAPTAMGLCGAFGAPIVFVYALANMWARTNELRIVSSSLAAATMRFAEPEIAATDAIVTVGQAIRHEIAAMGDGVERALARAAELEALVNSEVAALERAYNDNEARIGNLLAGLAEQRETLVGQAEQVRNAITNVHLDLSHDITMAGELIAERVEEAAQRVNRALGDRGEHLTVALGAAGHAMIEQLGERGIDLLKRIERTGEDTARAIDAAGDRLTSGLNLKSERLNEQFVAAATNLQQSLVSRLDDVAHGFSQKSSAVLEAVETRTRELTLTISEGSETASRALMDTTGRIAETIATRADEVTNSLRTTGDSIVLGLSLRGGDMVSKLDEIGRKLTEMIGSRGEQISERFGSGAETLAASIASRGDTMRDMLAQRLNTFEEIFARHGAELGERVAHDSTELGDLITRHLTEFDRTVRTHGSELVENLHQRTADIQELVATAVITRDDALVAALCSKIDEANLALATRASEVAENLESQIRRFEELLIGRTETAARGIEARAQSAAEYAACTIERITHEMGSRTGTAVERAAILVGKATEAIESRTHAAAEFAAAQLAGATDDMETRTASAAEEITLKVHDATSEIGKHTVDAFRHLLERSSDASQQIETRTRAAADLMETRAADLSRRLDEASSGLIAAISSKGARFAAEIEQAAESAVKVVDAKAFAFTQSIVNNSNELARAITDAGSSATAIMSRTLKELRDSAGNSVSQATIMVAQALNDLQQSARGAIEQSKQVAMLTVSEIHETHGMLRSDSTALFERLRDANGLLQHVLAGAQTNLNAIEQVLSTRVGEFVSTVEQLLGAAGATAGKLDRQVSSFYGLTTRVLGDLGELAVQFDGHGKALTDAIALLEKANDDTLASVTERKDVVEELAKAVDGRTEELDKQLKRFSNVIDVSLHSAQERARDAARLVAEATSEGSRALAERHAAIRSTTEQQSKQTLASLHELYVQVSSETRELFQQNAGEAQQMLRQATDRFAEIMHNMKQMSLEMQRELEGTRSQLRRGVLELPEETAESMAQMRRVIVDQMEALAELNRIVARHGRAMDTVGTPTEQAAAKRSFDDEEPAMASAAAALQAASRPATVGGDSYPRGRLEAPPDAAPRPSTEGAEQSAPQRAARVEEALPVAPAAQAGAGDEAGRWLSELLTRASRDDGGDSSDKEGRGAVKSSRPAAASDQRLSRPDDRDIRQRIESIDSLSVDIARMIDHEAAADLWERYDRGERNVFTRRLYTMQGRKAFDELRKRCRSDHEFRQAVDRYIGHFEQLLSEVGRNDRGHVVTRTYLTSDTGKLYTILAHAAGRFE